VFESVWMNDHLTDIAQDRHGASLEAMTAMATLVHRVPGRWVGHAVLSATFRHPAVLAKAATVLDHATGGRFILGLGAGWHEGEHVPLGIPLPPMPERFDRFESAVHVLKALFSDAAARPPGVTRPDRFYPLADATNEPPPLHPGGPPLWLGGQRRRGIALAAAVADGWVQPAVSVEEDRPSTLDDFSDRRAALLVALEAIGRDPGTLEFAAQVQTGETPEDRRRALAAARDAVERGATHIILGMRARLGPDGVAAVADEVARPLREHLG
jgi:Coenzyme F420-dependent N5,N10-methylene tetrahydromethanopterin reductase and related flavin-dependent oxidoreductases